MHQLAELGIKLSVVDEQLHCYVRTGALAQEMREAIASHKANIVAILESRQPLGLKRDETAGSDDIDSLSTELVSDAILDTSVAPLLAPVGESDPGAARSIFLTGASGFLGAFLLRDILEATQAHVYCLIRCETKVTGQKRIQESLSKYDLWQDDFSDRISAMPGNLEQPLLGLDTDIFDFLCGEIDVIYHCGALVNFIEPYHALRGANVYGTREIIRLASLTKRKPLHFISSVAVLPPRMSRTRPVMESDPLPDWRDLPGGYGQTKWVAEKLVMEAVSRGLEAKIYRPEMVVGDSSSGICNTRDFVPRMIIGCLQLGAAPNTEAMVGMVPVDYVSRAIVHLSKQRQLQWSTFHLVHPNRISASESAKIFGSIGYPLNILPYADWRQALLDEAKKTTRNALYPLLALLTEASPFADASYFDCRHTLEGLANTDITCPPIDTSLMSTYLSYFRNAGFLEATAASR